MITKASKGGGGRGSGELSNMILDVKYRPLPAAAEGQG